MPTLSMGTTNTAKKSQVSVPYPLAIKSISPNRESPAATSSNATPTTGRRSRGMAWPPSS